MQCTQLLKPTTEELALAVEKLSVPLSRLHPDGMGGAVVGQERSTSRHKDTILADLIEFNAEGCWIWGGKRDREGYGLVSVCRRSSRAHRVTYALLVGLRPNLVACHHCDNPPCVNPWHVFLGTVADNHRDCREKGRNRNLFGEQIHQAKLNAEKVGEIRERYRSGESSIQLAKKFGISPSSVSRILNGKAWKHTGDPVETRKIPIKIKREDIPEIQRSPLTYSKLAAIYGVSISLIARYKTKK